MAHKIARHSSEKLSFYQFFYMAAMLVQAVLIGQSIPFSDVLLNFGLMLPFSRKWLHRPN
jgi:hypothetical protein